MSDPLYTREVLRLASATADFRALDAPDGVDERRSPVCGSRVRIEVMLDEDRRVTAMGGSVRACAFGQASAALLLQGAMGRSGAELDAAAAALRAYLAGARDDPGGWPGLDTFAPARAHPGRHAAILLPFDSAAAAVRQGGG